MLSRHIRPKLAAALGDTPVVLLHGARQTGKTTLAREFEGGKPGRRYLTLDDPTVLAAAVSDPSGFIAGLGGPVILDEIQRAPALFPVIKASVDRDRTPGRFLLTGSANVLLIPRLSESLAGRVEFVNLWPLSQGEIEGNAEKFIDLAFAARPVWSHTQSKGSLPERIVRGGYPEPLGRRDADRRAAWFASYITAILQRDVRDLANIDGLADLPRLLALIASRTCGLLNFADLARSLSIPQSTLKRYFGLLEATFLVQTIPAWASNRGVRLAKAPKVLPCDTGLAAHVLGLDQDRLTTDWNARGPLLEGLVATELLKQATWSKARITIHHFRPVQGREVDLVLEDASGRIVGVEVKSAASVGKDAFGGLKALRESAGDDFERGIVLYDGVEPVNFDKDMTALPIGTLWSA